MPAATGNDAQVGVLDFTSAIEVMKKEYPRDGLDARTLLDSEKRGGLT
jgi:IMP dehydrogenase